MFSIMTTTTTSPRKLHVFRMHHSQMSGERIVSAESLLLRTEGTMHLLLARIVNRVFVPGEVVGPGEDSVTGLTGGGIYSLALVWASLGIALRR